MKFTSNIRSFAKAFSLAIVTLLVPTMGHAQSNQTIDSGTQTWDPGITQNWDSGTDTWTAQNNALFNSNTVNVSGTVTATQIDFMSGSTTISGGIIDLSGFGGGYTSINQYNSSGPNTISSELDLGPSGGDSQVFVNPNSGSTLTLGSMVWTPSGANDRVQLNAYDGGAAITLNGTYTSGGGGSINFGADTGSGTFNIASTADFSAFGGGFSLTGTALNIANSTFNGQYISFYTVTQANQINIQGAQNINLNFYSSQKNDGSLGTDPDGVSTVGQMRVTQSTADQSTWTGSSNQNGASTTLGAVAGGRLNWNVGLGSSTPLGLTVNAATGGFVVISSNSNNYDLRDGNGILQPGSTVAATLVSGTTLITNTANSAFGNNAGVVNVQSSATLGGSGISTEQIVVAGGGIIAPGDPGQAGLSIAPSIATLHLTGGLSMASGSTLEFKINGASNDMIALGAGALSLAGTTNVDFTSLGTVDVATPGNYNWYTLATGTGTWGASPTFNFSAPAGYVVDHEIYNPGTHTFEVDFAAVPEPSTYALMIGGLAFLAFCVRRKNRTV